MNRSLTLLVAVAALLALPAAASAYIQIDKGIAGARLGNTGGQVKAALGKPTTRQTGTNIFGPWVRYRYPGGLAVFFQGSQKRVTAVSTSGKGDRTVKGAGVGTTEKRLKALHPGLRCDTVSGFHSCHTKSFMPGQRMTIFRIGKKGTVTLVEVGVVID